MSGFRFIATLIAASFVLAACGGGGEDDTAAAANNTGGGSTGGGSTGGGSTGGGSTGGGSTGGGSGGGGTAMGAATLTWMPPTEYSDGSPLVIDHYTIHWGDSQGGYTDQADVPNGLSSYTVDQLASGTWYFVITAIDGNGVASTFSNVASKTI